MIDYIFINKAIFFPKSGILAIGDLHLGYEQMLKTSGINLPETQIKDTVENLREIILQIRNKGHKVNKIVFLGDIKHYFGYEHKERKSFDEVFGFLKEYFDEKDIILTKGNHDAVQYSEKKMKDYYIYDGIAFLHGHKDFPEIYDEKVKTIVMGHLHPSVIISDKQGIKKEKFKCFLAGKMKKKMLFILPSFFDMIEGVRVNDYKELYNDFVSMVPKNVLLNLEVFAIGKDEVFNFGKIKDLS